MDDRAVSHPPHSPENLRRPDSFLALKAGGNTSRCHGDWGPDPGSSDADGPAQAGGSEFCPAGGRYRRRHRGERFAIAQCRLLILGVVGNALSFFAFMALVQREPLSFAVPASSASFVQETLLAKFVLHERISFRRAAGTVIVLAGVVLVGGWRAYWLTRTGAATGASGTTGTRQPCRM